MLPQLRSKTCSPRLHLRSSVYLPIGRVHPVLSQFTIKSFKSLAEVEVAFPRLAVLFGPNAAGKSNLLDAVQALSRIGTSRTLSDALAEPIRGYPVEAFAFPEGGLAALLGQKAASFSLDAFL